MPGGPRGGSCAGEKRGGLSEVQACPEALSGPMAEWNGMGSGRAYRSTWEGAASDVDGGAHGRSTHTLGSRGRATRGHAYHNTPPGERRVRSG